MMIASGRGIDVNNGADSAAVGAKDDVNKRPAGANDGVSEPECHTELQKRIMECMRSKPESTISELADFSGFSQRTVNRAIRVLKENGSIRREGSRRSRAWIVMAAAGAPEITKADRASEVGVDGVKRGAY